MRRKVNNSEIHESKRYYKVPSEKVQEWSDTIENLTKQRDQFKAERNSLIDDLSWYKAKVSRLERENRQLSELNKQLTFENINCEHEIKALREQNYKYCKLGNHIRLKAENNPGVSRYIDLVNYIDRLERD